MSRYRQGRADVIESAVDMGDDTFRIVYRARCVHRLCRAWEGRQHWGFHDAAVAAMQRHNRKHHTGKAAERNTR